MRIGSFFTRFLAPLWVALALLPALGQAQTSTRPTIQTFTIQQVAELTPGTELVFQVNGTPSGTVTLALDGSSQSVALSETRPGRYDGRYTISLRDQIRHDSAVRATLRTAGGETQAVLGQTLLTASAHQRAVAAATPKPVIDFFGSQATGWTGGHEITLTVRGTPGATASVVMAGTDVRPAFREIQPGEYTTTYTIRTRDTLSERSLATVTLTAGTQVVRAEKPLGAPPVQPTLAQRQSCETCGVIQAVNRVEVEGEPGLTGAVAGGVAGAVLGSQIGSGSGRTAAQVLGAVGGAVAGREVERHMRREARYDVVVRLHTGTVQTVRMVQDPGLAIGRQVKIVDGAVLAND